MKKKFMLFYTIVVVFNCGFSSCVNRDIPVYAASYRALHNFAAFGSEQVGIWKDRGILGGYTARNKNLATQEWKKESFNIESMLGYCRENFICSQSLSCSLSLNPENMKTEKLRDFFECNKDYMKTKFGLSETNAQKLAFVTCFDVNAKTFREILISISGNRNGDVVKGGLTRSYTLEEAYVILHMHPRFHFWESFSKDERMVYVNLIAGALNAIIHGGDGSTIQINDRCPDPCVALKSVVDSYFEKFIVKTRC